MPLSPVVEYLLSYFSQTGDQNYASPSSLRINVVALPPLGLAPANRSENPIVVPSPKYGFLVYRLIFNPNIVPGALSMTFTIQGNNLYNDVLDASVLSQPFDCFALVSQPGDKITIVNNVGVAQNFEATLHYLTIQNKQDWQVILQALRELRNSQSPVMRRI